MAKIVQYRRGARKNRSPSGFTVECTINFSQSYLIQILLNCVKQSVIILSLGLVYPTIYNWATRL